MDEIWFSRAERQVILPGCAPLARFTIRPTLNKYFISFITVLERGLAWCALLVGSRCSLESVALFTCRMNRHSWLLEEGEKPDHTNSISQSDGSGPQIVP